MASAPTYNSRLGLSSRATVQFGNNTASYCQSPIPLSHWLTGDFGLLAVLSNWRKLQHIKGTPKFHPSVQPCIRASVHPSNVPFVSIAMHWEQLFLCVFISRPSFQFLAYRPNYLLVAPSLYNRPPIPCAVFSLLFSLPSLRILPPSPVCYLPFCGFVQIISFPLFDVRSVSDFLHSWVFPHRPIVHLVFFYSIASRMPSVYPCLFLNVHFHMHTMPH